MKKVLLFTTILLCGFVYIAEGATMFEDDVAFLKKYVNVIVLSNKSEKAQLAIVPEYQGRVMTSTANGAKGLSFGWINRELIASKKLQPHINAFGGEDRFWLGPEGGQFSIFFKKGDPFDLAHWQTPAFIDSLAYQVASKKDDKITFTHTAEFTNYSGTKFNIQIERTINLRGKKKAEDELNCEIPDTVSLVAYDTENKITNMGKEAWTQESGLLSIWILGMFTPSPDTTIVIPFTPGSVETLGPKVNDAYFGKVPAERLVIKDDVLFFSGDGKFRSKIGLTPQRAQNMAGSYDAANKVLTLIKYNKPEGVTDYVNSMWEIQDKPFAGDVVNSYNDGPAKPGEKPMGPFFELETSSPAAALKPTESLKHTHRTFHLMGEEAELNTIAEKVLHVSLEEIKTALKK